jgi:hypothetical protein
MQQSPEPLGSVACAVNPLCFTKMSRMSKIREKFSIKEKF